MRHALNVALYHLRRVGRATAAWLLPAGALLWLVVLAVIERPSSWVRRRRARRPRLIWGPTPIISLKYWSAAMRRRGYESTTCVSGLYPAHTRDDFDRLREDFLGPGWWSELRRDYSIFAGTLRHGDVFLRFFDGGYLKGTPLDSLELPLLWLAGKRVIVSPFGGDVAVVGHLGDLEGPLLSDYPHIAEASEATERRVRHTLRWASVAIANWQFGFLPDYDVAWPTMLAIDTEHWEAPERYSDADGRNAPVTVLHAPNHRGIKGTAHLERAVENLHDEGLQIDLRVLQGRPNEEIREAMIACDIAADQFLAGYAMFAVEGMALGKPVLTNLSSIPPEIRATEAMREIPLVDTAPRSLRDDLRALVESPDERRRLGRAGRRFVMRHHSYDAVADGWESVLAFAWMGRPLPASLLPQRPARISSLA